MTPLDNGSRAYTEGGAALLLMMFIILIASAAVLSLTYRVNLENRKNSMIFRGLQSEYYLKSALEFARILIANDSDRNADGQEDFWWPFQQGADIPLELFGLENEPGLRLMLEVNPVNAGLPLNLAATPTWRDALYRLFQLLGFDDDDEGNHLAIGSVSLGERFGAADLVAHLIDYLDADTEPYSAPDFPGTGIEDRIPQNYFPQPPERGRIDDVRELQLIPGFTPRRISRLAPYVHTLNFGAVNLNVAPSLVIQSLHSEMDEAMANNVYQFVRGPEGPFRAQTQWREQLGMLTTSNIQRDLGGRVSTTSRDYRIIAKVDFGESSYFMRARISFTPGQERAGELPRIEEREFFF